MSRNILIAILVLLIILVMAFMYQYVLENKGVDLLNKDNNVTQEDESEDTDSSSDATPEGSESDVDDSIELIEKQLNDIDESSDFGDIEDIEY